MILPLQELSPSSSSGKPLDHGESTTDGLVMRVHGGENAGKLVSLQSRKCTIGSARNCTLRLVSKDFRPVHCMILRGSRGTAVRCWSSTDTRLNGVKFQDDWLIPGDRLVVGHIEFEILSDRLPDRAVPARKPVTLTAPTESRAGTELRHHYGRRVKRLCQGLRDARRRAQESVQAAAERTARIERFESEIDHLKRCLEASTAESTKNDLEHRLGQISDQLDRWQSRADDKQLEWVERCRAVTQLLRSTEGALEEHQLAEWMENRASDSAVDAAATKLETELHDRQSQLDEKFRQVIDQQQHLDEREQQLEDSWLEQERSLRSKLQQLEADFAVRERQLAEEQTAARQTLEADQQRLADERALVEAERQRWQLEVDRDQTQLETLEVESSQLESQVGELEASNRDLLGKLNESNLVTDELRAAEAELQDALNLQSASFDEQTRDTQVQTEALEARIRDLESEQERLESELQASVGAADQREQVEELKTQVERLEQDRVELLDQLRELEGQQVDVESAGKDWELERERLQTQLMDAVQLAEECREAVEDRERLELQLADLTCRYEQLEEQSAEQQESLERNLKEPDSPPADIPPAPAEAPSKKDKPEPTASILARFAPHLFEDSGDTSGEADALPSESKVPEQARPKPQQDTEVTPAAGAGNENASENSIENYMAQLMERAGTKGYVQIPQTVEPVVDIDDTVDDEPAVVQQEMQAVTPANPSANPFIPRTKRPSIDLTAMRDVANETARLDISRHEGRQKLQEAYVTWCLAAAAFFIGISLIYWSDRFASLKALEAAAALVVGIFWTFRGVTHFQKHYGKVNVAGVRKGKVPTPVDDTVAKS